MNLATTGLIQRLGFSKKFGNFTNYHHTFGKYSKMYNPDTDVYSDFELLVLHNKDEAGYNVNDDIYSGTLTTIYTVVNWLFKECNGGVLTANTEDMSNLITTNFNTDSTTIVIDEMLSDEDGNILPNSITFIVVSGEDTQTIKLWLNSLQFDDEFTDSDIEVFGGVSFVDDMITNKANLLELLNNNTLDSFNQYINGANRTNPYTGIGSISTPWVNKDDPTETLILRFNFVCYGPVINNEVALKNALRKHIEVNSGVSDSVWEVVLPEIFTATSFIFIPSWDTIGSGTPSNAIYNPISNISKLTNLMVNNFDDYTLEHVTEFTETLPTMWQSLMLVSCSGIKNKEGFKSLKDSVPDYMLVESSSDFIRLTPPTKDFILKLNNTLPYAQRFKEGTVLPYDLDTEVINGFTFIVFSSYNLKCKVLVERDYNSLIKE